MKQMKECTDFRDVKEKDWVKMMREKMGFRMSTIFLIWATQ